MRGNQDARIHHKGVIQGEAEGAQRKSCPKHVTCLDTPVLSVVTLAMIFVTAVWVPTQNILHFY